jgi:hypothetical protein
MTYVESPPADIGTAQPVPGKREDLPLVRALAEGSEHQNQLYVRYRRPLLQVFLHHSDFFVPVNKVNQPDNSVDC